MTWNELEVELYERRRAFLLGALEAEGGNIAATARRLNIRRTHVYDLLGSHGLRARQPSRLETHNVGPKKRRPWVKELRRPEREIVQHSIAQARARLRDRLS